MASSDLKFATSPNSDKIDAANTLLIPGIEQSISISLDKEEPLISFSISSSSCFITFL